jgi:hypothetical protein
MRMSDAHYATGSIRQPHDIRWQRLGLGEFGPFFLPK